MRLCKKCVMPDTRPGSIFNEDGVCQACLNYDRRKEINWDERREKLRDLCDKYRRADNYYDCLIPVSGGKDSHFLTYIMKEEMKMNPLLVNVSDPFTKTRAGVHNFRNLGEAFNCDILTFNLSIDLFRRVTKIGFEELGEPLRFIEGAIYTVPFKVARDFNIPLIVYGEDSAYEYGTSKKESIDSGRQYIDNVYKEIDLAFWRGRGIPLKELNALIPLSAQELKEPDPQVIFMSFFVPWDGESNFHLARRYGFKDLTGEWEREGNIENYDQIDSLADIVHLWMKYPKFGFARTTDIASRWIRRGKISREQGLRLVRKYDHKLDQIAMADFIEFMGYTPRQFWEIIERFWNPELFTKINGIWKPKFYYE